MHNVEWVSSTLHTSCLPQIPLWDIKVTLSSLLQAVLPQAHSKGLLFECFFFFFFKDKDSFDGKEDP